VLSWLISEGSVDEVDVSGLAAVLVSRYDDDEPGSPWTIALHVDRNGTAAQRRALELLFLDGLKNLPWIRKARHLIGVRISDIEIDGAHIRVGSTISVQATRPVVTDVPVACGIPGYDRSGRELYADELAVRDDPFAWELSGNCAYESDFDYASQ
jgi:Protein of unknown function (DUF1326)